MSRFIDMKFITKQLTLIFMTLLLVSCGANPIPTSHLTEALPIIKPGPYGMEFSHIPGGIFQMGSPDGGPGGYPDEHLHWVKLTEDYWMQTTEVTRDVWLAVMGRYPDHDEDCLGEESFTQRDEYPVACVSWDEISRFIAILNYQTRNDGYEYRLPTEAEWEFATRGYSEGPYSVEGPLHSFAWYDESSGNRPHAVGKLKANKFGLYDVHGSVFEWVADWYAQYPKYYSYDYPDVDPKGPEKGTHRVLRGGSWLSESRNCRVANRGRLKTHIRSNNFGFRLARTGLQLNRSKN